MHMSACLEKQSSSFALLTLCCDIGMLGCLTLFCIVLHRVGGLTLCCIIGLVNHGDRLVMGSGPVAYDLGLRLLQSERCTLQPTTLKCFQTSVLEHCTPPFFSAHVRRSQRSRVSAAAGAGILHCCDEQACFIVVIST